MPKEREALKLALEALERYETKRQDDRFAELITAIREALAQPTEQRQEPVAWIFQHDETGHTMCVDERQIKWGFEKANSRWKKISPLYDTPQKRKEWVGLTDDERRECTQSPFADDNFRTIEAKLKEKNL